MLYNVEVNLALFLTPLSSVAWMPARASVREALDRMDAHGWSAVPILDEDGGYLGTLTEGDLLRHLRTGADLDATMVLDVPLRSDNKAVSIVAGIETVVDVAVRQNFVPVVDSRGVLMGIVTRKAVIGWLRRPDA
jgi:CBS domain-containing protein